MSELGILLVVLAVWVALEAAALACILGDLRRHKSPPERPKAGKRIIAIADAGEAYVFILPEPATEAERQVIIDAADRWAADRSLSFPPEAAKALANQLRSAPTSRIHTLRR